MQAMTNAIKRRVLACITPQSKNEDNARREYILNIILLISFFFLIILTGTVIYNTVRLGSTYHGIPLLYFITFIGFCIFALMGSRCGYSKIISFLLIGIITLVSTYSGWHWGASLPATLLMFALIVVTSSVLIGSRFGFIVSGILLVLLIILGYHEIYFLKELPWKNETIDKTDVITYSAILIYIVGITWLSNTEIEKSLTRARNSEKLLKEERDSLEIKVRERTDALRKSQIERMEELSKVIEFGKLSQGLFHDLMNPLSGIMLYMNTVKRVSDPEVTNTKEYIDKAVSISEKMGVLLAEIKKSVLQSLPSPQINIKETYFIENECDSVIHIYEYKARKANIDIVKTYDKNQKTTYTGCSVNMYRILSNIVANAIDALEPMQKTDKKIMITVKKDPTKLSDKIQIEISDNGPGIANGNISKIFEPFFTTKADRGGTGIGLSTVKNIVENDLKGTIEISSDIGKGTSFKIRFPTR